MEKSRINLMSLKKTNTSNKNTILSNYSSNSYYILPMIDKNIINSAYLESTSVLSNYIKTQVKNFYSQSQSFKGKNISKKTIKSSEKKIPKIFYNPTTKTESNEIYNKSSKHINFYLTAQEDNSHSSNFKINNMEGGHQNNIVNLTETNTGNKIEKSKKIESSISIDRILNKNQFKMVNSTFHRLRTYQPKISNNWKLTSGISVGISKINSLVPEDMEYQSKLFNDQYKLLTNQYQYYIMKILANSDFIDAFKTLNLKNKIEFNKSLEELCGLLIILPRHILAEFYKYAEYLKVPNKSSLKEKYIFDEVSCLYQNNKLLYEAFDFFKNSFEIYLILTKEVDGMALKQKEFDIALSAFERMRFNLSLICNIAENTLLNFTKEMGLIYKINRFESEQNQLNNIEYSSKLKHYKKQSKNKERQKKIKIDECLADNNYKFNYRYNRSIKETRKFKSIMDSKMVSRLLGHCKKDVKYNIITERINNEFDWNINENTKIKSKPIKINF